MQRPVVCEFDELLLEHIEKGKNKFEKLSPTPNDESFPQDVDEVAVHGVLVAGCEQGDDPRNNIALWGDGLLFEVVANFRVEDAEQPLKLVHLYFEHFEFVGEELFEAHFHEILKYTIGGLLIPGLDVQIAGNVVHALTVGDVFVEVGINPQQGVQNCGVEHFPVVVQRSINIKSDDLLHC